MQMEPNLLRDKGASHFKIRGVEGEALEVSFKEVLLNKLINRLLRQPKLEVLQKDLRYKEANKLNKGLNKKSHRSVIYQGSSMLEVVTVMP
jgi:hypothetical protein